MLQKISEAIRLFKTHWLLLSAIVLTVWLPGSIILAYFRFLIFADSDPFQAMVQETRISNLIETAFGPIYVGAMMQVLAGAKQGRLVSYAEAMRCGAQTCFKMFTTRLVSGLIVLGGLILLIVPGILLAVRYALIDPVVALEGRSGKGARQRSVALTQGRRWQLLGASVVSFLLVMLVSVVASLVIYFPVGLMGQQDNFFAAVLYNCIASILFSFLFVVVFLFYWEGRSQHSHPLQADTLQADTLQADNRLQSP
ncbi:MAG TPA: glycerophosphoryl diester phosphodiesterase membrane domain-containing protein [Chroococcidiopsis sp.]